jgi:hypothetical protein
MLAWHISVTVPFVSRLTPTCVQHDGASRLDFGARFAAMNSAARQTATPLVGPKPQEALLGPVRIMAATTSLRPCCR